MRIAIVEDNAADYRLLSNLLRRYADERAATGAEAEAPGIVRFSSAACFRTSYVPGEFDLIALDCYLQGGATPGTGTRDGAAAGAGTGRAEDVTGVDLARELRAEGDRTPVLFTTSSMDFVLDGYEVGAAAYLVKPIAYAKLSAALDRIWPADAADPERLFTVPVDNAGTVASLPVDSLRSCRVDGHYLLLDIDARGRRRAGIEDDALLRPRMPLRQLVDELGEDERFWACARGYLVNLDRVRAIDGLDFILDDGSLVPISRRNLSRATELFANAMFKRMRAEGNGMRA